MARRLYVLSCWVFLAVCCCYGRLPTEPIQDTTSVQAIPGYCQVIDVDPKVIDFKLYPDGTQVFTRVAYLPTPTWQIYISDSLCGPKDYRTGGWSIYIVTKGKLEPVGW